MLPVADDRKRAFDDMTHGSQSYQYIEGGSWGPSGSNAPGSNAPLAVEDVSLLVPGRPFQGAYRPFQGAYRQGVGGPGSDTQQVRSCPAAMPGLEVGAHRPMRTVPDPSRSASASRRPTPESH